MKPLFIIIALSACSLFLQSQVPDSIKFQWLDPISFQQKLHQDDNSIIIDVREFFEFRKSRINGAINIPSMGGYNVPTDTISKAKTLFFYCFSGPRSKRAALFFYDRGFRKIYTLKGGIAQWRKDGLPVIKKRLKLTSQAPASQSSLYTFQEYQILY
jgi:rhodanese-related sulfurtransferase